MAKKTKKAKKEKQGKKKSSTIILLVLMVVGVAVAQFASIILIVGIFPSIIANMVDRTPNRSIFHTVFPCNLAGVIPYVGALMSHGNNMTAVEANLLDLHVWFTMYIAAGLGWVLVLMMPRLVEMIVSFTHDQKANALSSKQKKLVEDWGPEVKRKEPVPA